MDERLSLEGDIVRYSSVSLSPTLGRNEKVEQYIRKKNHKPNILRFWVEGGVIFLYGLAQFSFLEISSVFPPRILPTHRITSTSKGFEKIVIERFVKHHLIWILVIWNRRWKNINNAHSSSKSFSLPPPRNKQRKINFSNVSCLLSMEPFFWWTYRQDNLCLIPCKEKSN